MSRTALENANAALKSNCERTVELMDLMDGEKSPTEEQLKGWNEEFDGLKAAHPNLRAEVERLTAEEAHMAGVKADLQALSRPMNPMVFGNQGFQPQAALKAAPVQFAESDAYQSWLKAVIPGGGTIPDYSPSSAVPNSAAFHVKANLRQLLGLDGGALKTIITGQNAWAVPADTSASAFVRPEFLGLIDEGTYQIPLGIADLPQPKQTDAEVVVYVKVNTGSQVAVITPEATSTSDSAALKPEGALSFTQGLQQVRTIPIWIPVTRQAAASAPGIMDAIEQYLRYEIQRGISNEMMNGDGTGQHWTGIYHLANKLTQAYVSDEIVTGRKALTNLLLNGRVMPTAWAMHPTDAERIDLTTDNEVRYYFGGPSSFSASLGAPRSNGPNFWGVPIRQTEFATVGSPVVGDWSKSALYDREATTMRITDSHSDYFTHNLLAVLTEWRGAFVVARDQAFCIVTFG